MSTSLYNTFGNEIDYKIVQNTLVAYLKDATIKFPLPEASTDILGQLTSKDKKSFDLTKYSMINNKLVKLGFGKPNADALSQVLIEVADAQGVDPLSFFEVGTNALNLTLDAYSAINQLRPAGSRVSIMAPLSNSRSRVAALIKP